MKKNILLSLLIIFSVVVSCTSFVGISGKAPLGSLDKYRSWFKKLGFVSHGIDQDENILGFGDAHVFIVDVETEPYVQGTFTGKVTVIADSDSTVVAVSALTSMQPKDKSKIFMRELWWKLTGAPYNGVVVLKQVENGKHPVFGNTFSTELVKGKWEELIDDQKERVRIVLSGHAEKALADDDLCCR